jgi:vacuolar-type H+-ATPase subunit H
MLDDILQKEKELETQIEKATHNAESRIAETRKKTEKLLAETQKNIATHMENALQQAKEIAEKEASNMLMQTEKEISQPLLSHHEAVHIAREIYKKHTSTE